MSPLVNVIGHLPPHFETLPRFLEQQIGVLARIDFDPTYQPVTRAFYERPFSWLFDARKERRRKARQLEALRMSMDMAETCLYFFRADLRGGAETGVA